MDLNKLDDLIMIESTEEMMKKILAVDFVQMIIAMKGDPYTGKTTCADAIAKSYNCSVVSFDHILDSFPPPAHPSGDEASKLINDAFDALIGVIRVQMSTGRPVVVDSPLADEAHLHKLLDLAGEFQSCGNDACDELHCRFVVVECRPGAKYAWEQRFVNRDKQETDRWYKPTEWNDVIRGITPSLENYPAEKLPGYTCRLIVDTTGCVRANYRYLGPATADICMCPNGHLLNFRDWLPHKPYHRDFNATYAISKYSGRALPDQAEEAPPTLDCSNDGRHLMEYLMTVDELGCCRACHGPISSPPAYACSRCKLALHQSCAELEEKSVIRDTDKSLPPYFRAMVSPAEFYSSIRSDENRKFNCSSCNQFSVDCQSCLWEMHLRLRAVPTLVRHEGHHDGAHSICFWISSVANQREYLCDACRLPGSCVGYTCLEGTYKYNVHVRCALLPRPLRHNHGNHQHNMKMVFGTTEIKEDYICDVCLKPILDPSAWFYSCEEDICEFVFHLHCAYEHCD